MAKSKIRAKAAPKAVRGRQPWSDSNIRELKSALRDGKPYSAIAWKLKRSVNACRQFAWALGLKRKTAKARRKVGKAQKPVRRRAAPRRLAPVKPVAVEPEPVAVEQAAPVESELPPLPEGMRPAHRGKIDSVTDDQGNVTILE
jgi:hypothetical protein